MGFQQRRRFVKPQRSKHSKVNSAEAESILCRLPSSPEEEEKRPGSGCDVLQVIRPSLLSKSRTERPISHRALSLIKQERRGLQIELTLKEACSRSSQERNLRSKI